MDPATRVKLVSILTEYDIKQSKKKSYNRYALGHYMKAVGTVAEAIGGGASLHDALKQGFCGSLLRHVAKRLGVTHEYAKWE